MERKEISKAVISRLPRYYRYLGELIEEGVEHILQWAERQNESDRVSDPSGSE